VDTWANVVKCATQPKINATSDATRDSPRQNTKETHHEQDRSIVTHDLEEHEKYETKKYSLDNSNRCAMDYESMILNKDTLTSDSNKMQDVDQFSVPPIPATTCAPVTKWSDIITTNTEYEHATEKQGKKREQVNLTNEIQKGENEGDEDTEEITRYKLPQTTSPKRAKKIKVDSDAKYPVRRREANQGREHQTYYGTHRTPPAPHQTNNVSYIQDCNH